MGEETSQICSVVFKVRLGIEHAERHVRFTAFHSQPIEDLDQVGVGLFIEDDEAGIDGTGATLFLNRDGVSVTTYVVSRLENMNVVFTAEHA